MKWLAFKLFLKKAWVWTKNHWYVPLLLMAIIIAFLISVIARNGAFLTSMLDLLDNSRESHKKEVDALNEIHSREAEEKNKILEEYNKNIKKLEDRYDELDEELDEEKKKELKRLVDESYNDPEKLARELAEAFGLKNHEHG
jgi:uncharacterized protein with von Willebrand factor type A (vWA) domain